MFFPVQGDPNYNSVVLALPMNGANNSTAFPDYSPSPKTVTRLGDTKISTTLGYPAAYFDGTGDWLDITTHADFAIGTSDFTIEAFVFVPNLSAFSNHAIVDCRPVSTNGAYPYILFTNTGVVNYYFTGNYRITSASGVIQENTLHHVAVCRSGSTTRLFVGGVQRGSSYSDSSNIPQSRWLVGGRSYDQASFAGYIRDFLAVKTAKYTANFTPPAINSFVLYGSNKTWMRKPLHQPSFDNAARLGL